MQVRLVAKQAPALVWSHHCDQAVTFQTVLQAYCDKYILHAQHASLTDSKGTAVNLSEVVKKSTLLLVHFQPTLCFFTWYYLYTLCPQPASREWLATSDARGAAQSALTCSFGWNYPADALISLLASEPQQLLPHDVLDSSLPLTAVTADSVPIQAHPVLRSCIRFLTGMSRYLNGQTLARHDQLIVSSRLHFLRALLLLQHLLRLVQPLATHSTDGPESMLVEVMCALFRHAPARLGFVDSSLATTASMVDHSQVQLSEPEEPPHFPQSTAFPGESETQQHLLAVLQLSDCLLECSIQKLWQAPESKRPLWPLLHPTVSALAAVFQWSDSSRSLTFFSEQLGGYVWPVKLILAFHRTEAYRLLHEMQRWFANKQALSIEQTHLLELGFLPMVAAYLRPQYVVGEEQEAEAGQRAFGATQHPLLDRRPISQILRLQQTADVLMTFITAQSGERRTTYSLGVAKSVGLQMFKEHYAEYKRQSSLIVTQPLPDGLSEQMDALHTYITLPADTSSCTEADDASVASDPAASPLAEALSPLQPMASEMPNGNAHISVPSAGAAFDTTPLDAHTAATATTAVTAAASNAQSVPPASGQSEAASNPSQQGQPVEPEAALKAVAPRCREFAQSQVTAVCNSPQQTNASPSAEPSTGSSEASLPWAPTEAEVNAILTAMANSGVHKVGSKHLYEQHWPTPDKHTWGDTMKLASQLAAVVDWDLRQHVVEGPLSMNGHNAFTDFTAASTKLKNSLIALLSMLLVGHMLDMSLDVVPLFQSTFHSVMKMWVIAEGQSDEKPVPQQVGFSVDVTRISQLGRAMLERLASDAPVRAALISSASDPGWQRLNLVAGVIDIMNLQRHMQKAACQLKVPFGAMHPDWLLMLDVLYMLITSQPFPADEVIAAQPFMPAEIGHDVAFLESNKAAQTTAAALFCFLQQLHGKQDTQGERELDSLDVRSMDEVLKTMHIMLTDPPEVDEQSCAITARLLHHFTSLYGQLPKALQEDVSLRPIVYESNRASRAAGDVDKAACEITYGLGPAEFMPAADTPKQTEAADEAQEQAEHQSDDLDDLHDRRNRARAALEAVSYPAEPILMTRLAWTKAVLQYLGKVMPAATKQQWSIPHYQLVTDTIIRLLQSLCPLAVFADIDNHGAYLAVFEETQAAQLLTDIMSAWLHYATVDVDWAMFQDLRPLIRKPTLLVAELLAYLQGTVLQPQHVHLNHYPYFGEKCFSGCLDVFVYQSNKVASIHTYNELDKLTRGPQLSAFAVCIEHSYLCQIPKEATGATFMALKPCLQWTCKLLEMLLSFHIHQQRLTKLALENHKQYQRLLKLLDKQLTNEAVEERDKALDESVTTKEKMQADRRHMAESYSRASAELDRMLAAVRTLHKDPLWALFVRHDEQETRLQVRAWTALLLADKVLPKAKIHDIHEYFAPCEAEASEEAFLAEEEQSEAKAAAKKAKKQRQKAKKGQQAVPDTASDPASSLRPAVLQESTRSPDNDHTDSHRHGSISSRPRSPLQHNSSAVMPDEPDSTDGLAEVQQVQQQLDTSCEEDSSHTQFLEELFCCPLTKVLMVDPVIAADGHTYERTAIQQWLLSSVASPVTSLPLAHTRLVPNVLVKSAIQTQMAS